MGLFKKLLGKDDEKKSCCCEVEIIEVETDETETQEPDIDHEGSND